MKIKYEVDTAFIFINSFAVFLEVRHPTGVILIPIPFQPVYLTLCITHRSVSTSIGQKRSAASCCSLTAALRGKCGCKIRKGTFYSKPATVTGTFRSWEG